MGSTCTWEEIVDHVSQEKWEVEYKVYVMECSHATRYFGTEDKQADTELPSPFHIDLDTKTTTEDWATIENIVNSMVNVVVDVCVPLSKVNLSTYGWPNVETARSLGNGNCAMHAYLLAVAGKQYSDQTLQIHNVQDGKKAMAEFFEILGREHVQDTYNTTREAEWPWARHNKRWACSNDQGYINEPNSFDEYVRVLREEPFWFSAYELQILATLSPSKQELFVCDEDGTRPRLIKKLSWLMRAIDEPMLSTRNFTLGDIMPQDVVLQYNGINHYEVRAHKDDMVVDVPQQRIESIDLTTTHDALNKQRIVMRRLAVGSIIGNLDLSKGDVVKAPTEPRLYNHVAKLDGESIVCIVHSCEFNNSYRLVGPDGMMESMFSRELLEPLQLPNRKWLNATLLESHWAMDEKALLTQWHRLKGLDVSNMKASSAGAQSSAVSSTGGLKARRAITKGKKASKAIASCTPKPLPADTETHQKMTACHLFKQCYKAKSYTVQGKTKPLPHCRNLLSEEYMKAIVTALMCEHDAKGKDVLEANKARREARQSMGAFAKKWTSILENYELQEDVGGPNPDVVMTKQTPITNTAGHKKRKSRDDDCGDAPEEEVCREVVTTKTICDVLWEVHTYGGTHNLSDFMYEVARAKYFGITSQMCRAFCACCPCAKGAYAKPKKVNPGYNALKTTMCLERVQVDLIVLTSMRPDLNEGFQYILTVKDHFSGFVWLRPLKNKDVRNVNAHLLFIFGDNGAPMILQSDNGSEFKDMAMTSKQFTQWVKKAGLPNVKNASALCHLMSSKTSGVGEELEHHFKATFPTTHMVHGRVKASSTQGSVERANQDVQRFLFYTMLYNESQGKQRGVWYPYLMDVQRRMNYQKKKSRGGKSPHEIFYGRDPLASLQRFNNLSPSLQKELMGVWVDFTSEY